MEEQGYENFFMHLLADKLGAQAIPGLSVSPDMVFSGHFPPLLTFRRIVEPIADAFYCFNISWPI